MPQFCGFQGGKRGRAKGAVQHKRIQRNVHVSHPKCHEHDQDTVRVRAGKDKNETAHSNCEVDDDGDDGETEVKPYSNMNFPHLNRKQCTAYGNVNLVTGTGGISHTHEDIASLLGFLLSLQNEGCTA